VEEGSEGQSLDKKRSGETTEEEEEDGDDNRSEGAIQADYDRYRNRFARFRARHPEPMAEFLATTVTVFLSLAGLLTTRLDSSYGTYETQCWAFGLATMVGIYLGGGVSGAHINPIMSIVLAIYRGFPWRKCRVYIVAQFLGSLTGGGLAYLVYHDAIHSVDPGLTAKTARVFYTTPQPHIGIASAFFSEFMAMAIFVCIVFALGDDENSPPGSGMNAFIIGLVVTLMGLTMGYNTGPSLNPMRDMSTRLVALMAGYGTQTFRNWWWIGGVWGADLAGGLVGAAVYDVFVFVGGESPVNYPWPSSPRIVEKLKKSVKRTVKD